MSFVNGKNAPASTSTGNGRGRGSSRGSPGKAIERSLPAPAGSMALMPDRPKDLAFRSIVRTVGLIERVMQPYFANFGITGSQWGVLRVLHRAEAEGLPGLRLTDLSQRLIVRPPSVTGVIDRLERLGLVTRVNASDDLRVKQVSLTPKARQLLGRVLAGHSDQIDAALAGLSNGDHENLHRLLIKLNTHLESMADEGSAEGSVVRVQGSGKKSKDSRERTNV
jgi:DNA-binding MarR family transcriptional regulator